MAEHDDLIQRLHNMGTQPIDGPKQSADLTAMAGVRAPRIGSKLRLAGAFLAGLLIGSTGLAAADVLPDPAQHAAHTVLSQVGVQVPDPERYHGPECGAEVKKNHGAYVKADHALAKSGCGKKVGGGQGKDEGSDGTTGAPPDKGPCHGKPPWAGDKTLTDEEKAAAEAERDAQCPDEADEADGVETPETEAPEADDPTIEAPAKGATTTTGAPTTTTTVAETTTTTV
jgi:hypothetical protein